MCGIVGISSNINIDIVSYTFDALKKLEYRGYDSCGISYVTEQHKFVTVKKAGNVENLKKYLDFSVPGKLAVAHTRWATHGAVNDQNAHPFVYQEYAMVLNGIVENYEEIKNALIEKNYQFSSDTDAEVLLFFIIDSFKTIDFVSTIKVIKKYIKGNFSFVLINTKENYLIGMKQGLQIILGEASEFSIVASDKYAFPKEVKHYINLQNGDSFYMKDSLIQIYDEHLNIVIRDKFVYNYDNSVTDKQGFETYMLKEMNEQPEAARRMLAKYLKDGENSHLNAKFKKIIQSNPKSIQIIACGSSYYAGMQFKDWCRKYLDTFVEISIASEFVFYDNIYNFDLYILISQSGETKDTLLCAEKLSKQKDKLVAIVNVEDSSLSYLCDTVLPIYAGKEIGVASTKAFFNQMMLLLLIVYNKLGKINQIKYFYQALDLLEVQMNFSDFEQELVNLLKGSQKLILSSRGSLLPICYEVTLKIKELSYRQVETIPSGEMKHGSISLIDESTVMIFFVNSKCDTYEKLVVNINEIILRGAKVIIICDAAAANNFLDKVLHVIQVNLENILPDLYTIFYLIEGQKLAYYFAKALNNNIDMPRNLAKSVTVE